MQLANNLRVFEWFGLGVALGLLLLYLLRPRRRRVEVPFGGLWQRVLAQSEASVLGPQWRRWLSLLLLIGIAALIWGAGAWPLMPRQLTTGENGRTARHTAVIIDCSASMATVDGQVDGQRTTRMQEAVARAQRLVREADPEGRFLLIAASGHPRVLAGWGTARPSLSTALASLRVRDAGLDLERALASAEQSLAGHTGGQVLVISDGGRPLVDTPPLRHPLLRWIWVGPARAAQASRNPADAEATVARTTAAGMDNLAIERVGVRPDPADPGRGTLTLLLRNDTLRDQPVQLFVAASTTSQAIADFSNDSALRRVEHVVLPAGRSTQVLANVDLDAPRLAVRVRPAPGVGALRDLAPFDDWAFAVLAQRRELKVLLVTAQDLFLEAALHASDRTVVQTLAPDRYHEADFGQDSPLRHSVDVVVLDQVAAPLPSGTPGLRLALRATQPSAQTTVVHNAELVTRATEHPLMRGVSFQDTNFDQVRLLEPQPGDVVLAAASRDGPVMIARQGRVRQIEWGIDLAETDLGGRYALPILIGNATAWLAGQDEPMAGPLELGRPWAIEAASDAQTWLWREPGQAARPARAAGSQLLASSEIQGIHTWTAQDGQVIARATALPPSEQPGDLHARGAAWQPAAPSRGPKTTPDLPLPARLLLGALAALLLEWLLYLRRRTL